MPYKNRIRLPIMFIKPQFPVERNTFRLADGSSKVLSMIIRNTYEGKTDQLPEDWHRKLVIAMSHDTVNVENERLLSGVTLDGDYGIDWQDFLQYPIAPASFNVQVTPFNVSNNNCQTCEEISQVVCVDDTTDEVWEEGSTNEFPDNLTANDSICCAPYTVSLLWWNAAYFTAVSVTPDGVLTATVIDPAPIVNDVHIAVYQVTCESGAYDRADVYGNITGSDEDFCPPPGGVGMLYVPTGNSTTAEIQLDAIPIPAPSGGASWELFLSSDLGTIIQSGVFGPPSGFGNIIISGLTAGVGYTICASNDCGEGNTSLPICIEFTITSFAASTCGSFTVTYLPYADAAPQSISYMDCAGGIQNLVLAVAGEQTICMLIIADTETPLYYVASSADITLTYVELCT